MRSERIINVEAGLIAIQEGRTISPVGFSFLNI